MTASTDRELETAFSAAVEQNVGALFINIDSFLFVRRQQIAALAARPQDSHDPSVSRVRRGRRIDELRSELCRRVAPGWDLCRQDSQSAKPADLPVLQPTKFDLVINLKACESAWPGGCHLRCSPARTR